MTTTKTITNGKLIYAFEDGFDGPCVQVEVYTHQTKAMPLDETCSEFDWSADAREIASWLIKRGVTITEANAFLRNLDETFESMGYTFVNNFDKGEAEADETTTTITVNDETIAKLESKGFRRWTKGRFDRLYINPKSYGVEYTYYKSGKVEGGTINGERFGACEARNFLATKVYIDVTDGTLHIDTRTDYEDEIRTNVEAIIAAAC